MCFWIQHMGFRLRTVLAIRPSSPLSLTPTLSQRERGLIDVFWIQRMGFRLRTVLAIRPSSPLSLWEWGLISGVLVAACGLSPLPLGEG